MRLGILTENSWKIKMPPSRKIIRMTSKKLVRILETSNKEPTMCPDDIK